MKTAILFLLMAAVARADSVETSDKLTVFGHIERMDEKEVTLTATFPSENGVATKELKIPRSQVVEIEFNATTFNPGGPPGIGARPADGKSSASTTSHDLAVLVDGSRQPCDGATIDTQQHLHCGKQEFPRETVIRIFLATK